VDSPLRFFNSRLLDTAPVSLNAAPFAAKAVDLAVDVLVLKMKDTLERERFGEAQKETN
jgi:hypothetical protein